MNQLRLGDRIAAEVSGGPGATESVLAGAGAINASLVVDDRNAVRNGVAYGRAVAVIRAKDLRGVRHVDAANVHISRHVIEDRRDRILDDNRDGFGGSVARAIGCDEGANQTEVIDARAVETNLGAIECEILGARRGGGRLLNVVGGQRRYLTWALEGTRGSDVGKDGRESVSDSNRLRVSGVEAADIDSGPCADQRVLIGAESRDGGLFQCDSDRATRRSGGDRGRGRD